MSKKKKAIIEDEVERTSRSFAKQMAQKTGMSAGSIEEGVQDFIKRSSESLPQKYSPPYGSVTWYEKFFEIAQNQKLVNVDLDFISLNIIGSKNEYKVLRGLKFLGLVNENDSATEKLDSLRVIGEAFEKRLSEILKDAYHELFSTIILNRANKDNLINFFMQRYNYSKRTASEALKIFVRLCELSNIPISDDLTSRKNKKNNILLSKPSTRRNSRKSAKPVNFQRSELLSGVPDDMTEIKMGKIIIQLPKNDRKAAIKARKLLDLYLQEMFEEW